MLSPAVQVYVTACFLLDWLYMTGKFWNPLRRQQ